MDELRKRGCLVVRGPDRPIAVFEDDGKVRAVDNRCPHLGFPLSRGSVQDGILTCHWHHARFDLSSGCTFDLFADDVPTCRAVIRDGGVYVTGDFGRADERGYWERRLREGMETGLGLIVAKGILGLRRHGGDDAGIVRRAAEFGTSRRDGWAAGMTVLTIAANLLPDLAGDDDRFLALYQGARRVSADCQGQAPRIPRAPLEEADVEPDRLGAWFRYWVKVRHRDGAERTLLTVIDAGTEPSRIARLLVTAACDRPYAAGGHALDFINKGMELLDRVGWERAAQVLPSLMGQLVEARGGEESNAWRHPVDLLEVLARSFDRLPSAVEKGKGRVFSGERELGEALLGEDPEGVTRALEGAMAGGATPAQLGRALAYAAALRVARFGSANEFGDWLTALHTFSYANAVHRCMVRLFGPGGRAGPEADDLEPLRAVFHGAMSVHLDRFLNVPPARLPDRGASGADAGIHEAFLSALNRQQQVDEAAGLVAGHVDAGRPLAPLVEALFRGVFREDFDFHTAQMLEAGLGQAREWGTGEEARTIVVAVGRYLAAHSPTQRAQLQTAQIALRLARGESLHEETIPAT